MRGWFALCIVAGILAACESGPSQGATANPLISPQAPLSPTVEPVSASPPPTARATPTPPPAPARLSDLPYALVDYLNADPLNVERVRSVLAAWGINTASAPLANMGDVSWTGDLDGDGQPDLLVALAPADPGSCEMGAVALYMRAGARYRLAQQIGLLGDVPIDPAVSHIPCPRIFAVRDLLADGHSEIVLTSTTCGAHTCDVKVDILRWTASGLQSLIAPPTMAYPEITLQAAEGGTLDLVLRGGVIGSLGAGPQRERQEVYRWNGTRFVLAQTLYDPSDYLYFKIVDANSLMQQARYSQAIALYDEALTNSQLVLSGIHPGEREDLQAFARFRILVAYALLRDFPRAAGAADDLARLQPDHVYAQVGQLFWDAFSRRRNVAGACTIVTSFAAAHPEVPAVVSGFGYANPDLTAADICPFH